MSTQETNPAGHTSAINKPGVLSLAIKEKTALYSAYMPFVTGGGLFIPNESPIQNGG